MITQQTWFQQRSESSLQSVEFTHMRRPHLFESLWFCLSILITTCPDSTVNQPLCAHTPTALLHLLAINKGFSVLTHIHKETGSGARKNAQLSAALMSPAETDKRPALSPPEPDTYPRAKPRAGQGRAQKIKNTEIDARLRKGWQRITMLSDTGKRICQML